MPTTDIPFPLSSAPGRSPQESAGRLINCYAESLQGNAGSNAATASLANIGKTPQVGAVHRRVPGLTSFAIPGAGPACRGFLEVNGVVYVVISQTMYVLFGNGTVATVGSVSGSKKVFMARNNKTPTPDLVMVTEIGAFVFTSTTITAYPGSVLPPQPAGVTFQDGYFFFPISDGRCFASNLNSTTINALSFATAESKPDGLIRAVPWNNNILLMGANSTEFWSDAGTTPGFPYARSTAIARGLAAATAIAGHEDGFGGSALIWVADHNRVVMLNGYTPTDISPPDLDRLIEAVTDKTTLEACVYVAGGAPRWVLSSNDWTWEFNLNSNKWNERQSYGLTRWRGTQSVWAFGDWLVGDTQSGAVFAVDDTVYTEAGDPLIFRLESGAVQDFPNRTRVARVDVDFATGVGLVSGMLPDTDPIGEVAWSDDGGTNWSQPIFRPLGERGVAHQRITVTRTGMSGPRGRRWRLTISDPVYAAVTRASQSTELRDH
jgi:hypothetical protein